VKGQCKLTLRWVYEEVKVRRLTLSLRGGQSKEVDLEFTRRSKLGGWPWVREEAFYTFCPLDTVKVAEKELFVSRKLFGLHLDLVEGLKAPGKKWASHSEKLSPLTGLAPLRLLFITSSGCNWRRSFLHFFTSLPRLLMHSQPHHSVLCIPSSEPRHSKFKTLPQRF